MKLLDTIGSLLKQKGTDIWFVSPGTSVFEAISVMSDKGVGALLVIDNGKLVGIISERDYARKVILKGKSSRETPVSDIMTSQVITITTSETLDDSMMIMTRNRIRHLPVLENGRIVGVISIGDLVKWIISIQGEAINQLENYITGKYPA